MPQQKGRAICPKSSVERAAGSEIGALPWEGGVLSAKAPREVWPARRSEPYLGDAGCGGDGPRGLDLYREVAADAGAAKVGSDSR